MVTNSVTLTDGSHPIVLTNHARPEATPSANVAEVPIPGRFTGGQIQVIAAPQWRYTVTGILNSRAGNIGGSAGGAVAHTDDEADFEEGGYLELMKNNTTADTTFVQTDNGVQIRSVTVRILEYPSWRIQGAQMNWWGYSLKMVRKQ